MSDRFLGVVLTLFATAVMVLLLTGVATAQEEPEKQAEPAEEPVQEEEPVEESERAPEPGDSLPCVGGEYVCGKGFVWTTDGGEYSLRIGGMFQFHNIVNDYDHTRGIRNHSEFGFPRAYLFVSGHASKEFKYALAYRIDNGIFDDWNVTWTPEKLQDKVSDLKLDITMGKFKPKFSREFLTSSGSLSIVNRSLADTLFRLYRDCGINFTGKLLENKLKLDLGFFNGLGDAAVDNTRMRATTRVQLDMNKPPKTQGDPKRSKKPRLSLGFAYSFENDVYDFDGNGLYDDNGSRWTADLTMYWQGLNIICAHFQRTRENYKTTGPADPYESDLLSRGYSIQGSFFVLPKKLEVVGLMSYIEPDIQVSHLWQHETRCGISYYLNGHSLKVQADCAVLRERLTQGSLDDYQVRVQFTLCF